MLVTAIEPMLPLADGRTPEKRAYIDNLTFEVGSHAASLNGLLHPIVQNSIGCLVRSMNCYYSNLIENHYTHPIDIERALNGDYSLEPEKRNLQIEAAAHIKLQTLIDENKQLHPTISIEFIQWLHQEFYLHLPPEFQYCTKENGEKVQIQAGEFRQHQVQVGQHIAVSPENIERFLKHFIATYNPKKLGKHQQVIAVAASHHRLLWIHPFLDGNGRITRLFSHAYLKEIGVGNSLWSISRGLARSSDRYKEMLAIADETRRNDLDGRGALSLEGLQDFCIYFLEQCIDQITFMRGLLRFDELLKKIELYTKEQNMHPKAFRLLKEALLLGEYPRGKANEILDMSVSNASKILNELVKEGLLISETPKGNVKLGFPTKVLHYWLPGVYP